MKRFSSILIIVFCVGLIACAHAKRTETPDKAPDPLDKWRIEVGPPGNEFFDAQAMVKGGGSKKSAESKVKEVQPSETLLRWAKVIAPGTEITATVPIGPGMRYVISENQAEQYLLVVSDEAGLVWLKYTDKTNMIEETANAIVPKGKKQTIAIDLLPAKMVETLATLIPDSPPSQAWYADTLVGPRYIAKVGEAIFYATPGGNIRTGASVGAGGLAEVAADATMGPFLPASIKTLLTQYRERFNFQAQIDRLRESTGSAEEGYRFVVMGDSRSQKDLWEAITIHIDQLDPKPLFVMNAGDVILNGTAAEYADYYIPPLLNTDIPYFIAIGNHDTGVGGKAGAYKYLFGEQSLNYTFDVGKIRFIILDNISSNLPWEEALEMADQWLAKTPDGYQKIVMTHAPPATIEKWAYHAKDPAGSKMFTDLMTKHGVDEVFLGHIHAYSTATLDDVSYTIAGGGGAELHKPFGPLGNVHHYIICDVTPDGTIQQVVRFYRKEGTVAGEAAGAEKKEGKGGK
ncbi:MAG: metallophosphoesterase [Desulfobacterales bacterium]